MIQLIAASTLFQVASLAAMIDADALPAADGERVLMLVDGSQQPELTGGIQHAPGFADLARRFDRVVDLGELVFPRRPAQFNPRDEELYLWERLMRSYFDLGDERIALFIDSIQVNPARAILRIFHDAPFMVHSDGLMSYGPTRNLLPPALRQRLDGLLYLDLVPGLQPLLLREFSPRLIPVPTRPLAEIITTLAASTPLRWQPPGVDPQGTWRPRTAMILGQYLAHLGLVDDQEEAALHRGMVLEAQRRGASEIIFKPHPSAGPAAGREMERDAAELGLGFTVLREPVLAEVAVAIVRPDVVISCFSTALVSIRALFGTECAAVGTETMLERLAPYENSNRIPVTLIDALFRRGLPLPAEDPAGQQGVLTRLLTAVGYCMQPRHLAGDDEAVRRFLATDYLRYPEYFKRRRLTRLSLPGGLPPRTGALGFALRLKRRLPARLHTPLRRIPRHLVPGAARVGRS
ncbi:polysialyltransferase family glycosyltransferase [Arthrobacter sp.]|uniref:polysialyltransferase family glycosyltransferase n=1 Tax=Arthrobacter sp. TaxID=1667 RepID=UPI003A94F9CF